MNDIIGSLIALQMSGGGGGSPTDPTSYFNSLETIQTFSPANGITAEIKKPIIWHVNSNVNADYPETGSWGVNTDIAWPLVCNGRYVSFIEGPSLHETHNPQNTYNPYSKSTFIDADFKSWHHTGGWSGLYLHPPKIEFLLEWTYSSDGIYGEEVISGKIYTASFSTITNMSNNTNAYAPICTSMTNPELRDFFVLYTSQIIDGGLFE